MKRPFPRASAPVSPRAVLRLGLALLLISSEASPLLAERDLWSERRTAVAAARSAGFSASGGDVLARLAAAFPSPDSLGVGPLSEKDLPASLTAAVGLYADVADVVAPSRGERRTLIHVHDLHEVEEAQRNTAAVLEQLAQRVGKNRGLVIGLEGATGGFRTADFRALGSASAVSRTADRFLRAGLISGSEYFSLTTGSAFRLWGAEDAAAYRSHVQALTATFVGQSKDDARVALAVGRVESLKTRLYPPPLQELDRLRAQYEQGTMGLAAYARRLAMGPPAVPMGSTLSKFLKALEEEDALDSARVLEDQHRFLKTLAPRLSPADVRRLVEAGVAHRMGRTRFAAFHSVMQELGARYAVPLGDTPHLAAYAAYASRVDGLDRSALLNELNQLAEQKAKALRTSPLAEELSLLAADVGLVKKVNGFSCTPEDFRHLAARRVAIRHWSQRGAALAQRAGARLGPWPEVESVVKSHEGFYRWAEERNAPLVNTLLTRAGGFEQLVLVAGGYHADGVKEVARARGLGYVALIPRLVAMEALPEKPLASFREGLGPLERLARGNPGSLHPPLLTAAQPLAVTGETVRSFQAGFAASAMTDTGVEQVPTLSGPLEVRVQRLTQGFAEALRRWGFRLRWTAPPRLEQGNRVALAFYLEDGMPEPGGPRRYRFETGATLGARPGEENFKMKAWSFREGAWSARLRSFWTSPAEAVARRGAARMAVPQLLWWLGQSTARAATAGASTLKQVAGWVGLTGLAQAVDRGFQSLRWSGERRFRNMALAVSGPGRYSLLARLAEAHPYGRMPPAWQESIVNAVDHFARTELRLVEGATPRFLKESALSTDGTTLSLIFGRERQTFVLRVRVSDARILYQDPQEHSLSQLVRAPEANTFDVFLQLPVLSTAEDVPNRVLGRVIREAWARVQGTETAQAHREAIRELDERQNSIFLNRLANQDSIYRLHNKIVSLRRLFTISKVGSIPDWLKDPSRPSPAVLLAINPAQPTGVEPSKNGGLISLFWGSNPLEGDGGPSPERVLERAGPVARALSSAFPNTAGVWAEANAALHLREKALSFDLWRAFVRAGGDLRKYWPGSASQRALHGRTADLVLDILQSTGREAGQLAAFKEGAFVRTAEGVPGTALEDSVVNRFSPIIQVTLGLLTVVGIDLGKPGNLGLQNLLGRLLKAYAQGFREGYLRLAPGSTDTVLAANPGTAQELALGLFHVSEPVEDSVAVGELLKALVKRAQGDQLAHFRTMLLLDFEGARRKYPTDAHLTEALRLRLKKEQGDRLTEAGAAVDRFLTHAENSQALFAGDVERDGKVSLERVFNRVTDKWNVQMNVDIFTPNSDRFLNDVHRALVNWVIYLLTPGGLIRVSETMEAARAAEEIRRFIQQNA